MPTPAHARLQRRLLAWYDRCRRDLPWRQAGHDAYRQWLAESMLQQTQVSTVLPYYAAFTARFPTVQALAAAPLDHVLKLWAGLGYYARARNLHRAARQVVEQHGGRFPDTVEGLMALPGVGRYTAGAVASIAFGRRAPILDGNVKRVLARVFAIVEPIENAATLQRLWLLAGEILPRRRCGDFNQALMELGATVCTPRQPTCERCPLESLCQAAGRGLALSLPLRRPRRPPAPMEMVVACIAHRGRLLLRQRPQTGLWGGLWELPSTERRPRQSRSVSLAQLLDEVLGPDAERVLAARRPRAAVMHQLTHRTVRFQVFDVTCAGPKQPVPATRTGKWLTPEQIQAHPLGAAQARVLGCALGHPQHQRSMA